MQAQQARIATLALENSELQKRLASAEHTRRRSDLQVSRGLCCARRWRGPLMLSSVGCGSDDVSVPVSEVLGLLPRTSLAPCPQVKEVQSELENNSTVFKLHYNEILGELALVCKDFTAAPCNRCALLLSFTI